MVTDSQGNYALPNLPVGPYRLEVKAAGFKDYVESGHRSGGQQQHPDQRDHAGGRGHRNSGSHGQRQPGGDQGNSVSSVVDQQRINDLPLNGRQATQLILTLGAAAYGDSGDTGSKTFWSATRISVAGGQGNGTAYLLDGGDNTDAMSNVNMPFPFPDALQEFSVETSAVSSRFGTHPGATVNVVTKSGSNAIPWRPVRIPPQRRPERAQLLRAGPRHPEAQPVRRHRRRQDHQGQAVLLRRLSGHAQPVEPAAVDHAYSHRGDADTATSARIAGPGCQSSGKALTLKNPWAGPFANNMIPQSHI